MLNFSKPLSVFLHKMASSRWVSKGHLWVTGSGFSNAWTVLLLVFHPLSLFIGHRLCWICWLVWVFLAFVPLLAWPAADHNSAIAFGLKASNFQPFICLALGARGVSKGGGWNLEVSWTSCSGFGKPSVFSDISLYQSWVSASML